MIRRVPDAPALKGYRLGTHRLCDPHETYERVRPVFPTLGITRVADVTRLDRIGIPTYQAIRPNSRSLSVSQGKGFTAMAAKVSAVMESVEMWHAERLPAGSRVARLADIEAELGYDLFGIVDLGRSLLNRGTRLDWLDARRMDGSGQTFVPGPYVSVDSRVARRWAPPMFLPSTNGLASGNSVGEASLHALLELVERDGTTRARALTTEDQRPVDVETVDAPEARDLLQRLDAAGIRVEIRDERGPTMLPSFATTIWSEDHPFGFAGWGCHLDPNVALCRALSEAAQSRLAQIAGSRDDVSGSFRRGHRSSERRLAASAPDSSVRFGDITSLATDDIEQDLGLVVDKVKAQTGVSPIVVDLTREELGIPVVKVVAPGLAFDHEPLERRRA